MAVKTVRTAIRDHLKANCPSFTGGFLQPKLATKLTPKPFGVIRLAGDDAVYQGATRRIEVICHADRGNLDSLDVLAAEVVGALDKVMVSCGSSGGRTYYVEPHYTGATADWDDDDRETVMRIVEFEVVIAR